MSRNRFLCFDGEREFYIYDRGIYIKKARLILEKEIRDLAPLWKMSKINEEIARCRGEGIVYEVPQTPDHLLCIQNGILDMKEYKVIPHSMEHVFFSKIPVHYRPELGYDRIDAFIRDLVTDEEALLLQEFIGYCLMPKTTYQKALILHGIGGTGKSTFIKVISNFLGSHNVSSVSLQNLENNKFMVANLVGKYINVFADLPNIAVSDTSITKSIITGDSIEVERKNKQAFSFSPFTKLIFSCNDFPEVGRPSSAFYRRWVVVKFQKSFIDKPIPDKEREFYDDQSKSEILNWALEGHRRLVERGKFDVNPERVHELWDENIRNWYLNENKNKIIK